MAALIHAHVIEKRTRTPLIHSSTTAHRSGIKHYVRALRKYNITPTVPGPYHKVVRFEQHDSQALLTTTGQQVRGRAHVAGHMLMKMDAESGESGHVPAQDVENNALYLAPVDIGTPTQTFNLDFDTGSADLWVWSVELPADDKTTIEGHNKHNIFSPSKSSTWKTADGSTWQITYGDGSAASGDVGYDNVTIGGLLIKNQAVELAQKLSPEFVKESGDGLCGLAFGAINTVSPQRVATPVENMIKQDNIKKDSELFTCWLDNTAGSSWYTFGHIDKTAVNNIEPSYTPVDNSNGFWSFPSASVTVNGDSIERTGNTAIADTGTTLCMVDDATCEAIYGAIDGAYQDKQQQGWVFPTDTPLDSLPGVDVAVGDTLFTINPADLGFQDLGNGFTYGGIQSRGDMAFDILGDVFLRSVYAIFDQGNTRFGCVQRLPSSDKQVHAAASSGALREGHAVVHVARSSGGLREGRAERVVRASSSMEEVHVHAKM
ncbi:hypothetical protein LTR53_011196 [Teratosphaeriaceae sp. CCFEE 6253]|nr:hypothetical protein LTR53_011196 [Teratosphaeriaceae sp. CCFEE 6253]